MEKGVPTLLRELVWGKTFTRLMRVSLVARVWRRFFGALFDLKHRKISRKPPERAFFFFCAKVGLHETLVIVPTDANLPEKVWREKGVSRRSSRNIARDGDTKQLTCTINSPYEAVLEVGRRKTGRQGSHHERRKSGKDTATIAVVHLSSQL